MASEGFVKAQTDNLPKVDSFMLLEFMKSNSCFNAEEIRGVKVLSSMRSNYIDNPVGYVEVKRDGKKCTVKGEVCPEHKVKAKNYKQIMIVDEEEETVEKVKCLDYAAAEGGCKYAVAFLMWVHEKSSQPAPTEVECYWKKPRLSGVGSTIPFVVTAEFGVVQVPQLSASPNDFFQEFVTKGIQPGADCQVLKHFRKEEDVSILGLHRLLHAFRLSGCTAYEDFIKFARNKMTYDLCASAVKETKEQSSSNLWFDLRYGRLTASKIYNAAHTLYHKSKLDGTNGMREFGVVYSLSVACQVLLRKGSDLE